MDIEKMCEKIVGTLEPYEMDALLQILLYEDKCGKDNLIWHLQGAASRRSDETEHPKETVSEEKSIEYRMIFFKEEIGYGAYLGVNGRNYIFDYVNVPNENGEDEEWEILSYNESLESQNDQVFKVICGTRNEGEDSYTSVAVEVIPMTCRQFLDKYRPGSYQD